MVPYLKRLKKLLHNGVIDIILFGSAVKSGFAKDIDVAIVVDGHAEASEVKESIRGILPAADVQIVGVESIYSSIWLTLIKEGFSIKKQKFLSELYSIKPVVLFKYSLKKLSAVQKVQFSRGLKNTIGSEGTILTRTVILVPMGIKNKLTDLLKTWHIYYECQEYELLPVLRKAELL